MLTGNPSGQTSRFKYPSNSKGHHRNIVELGNLSAMSVPVQSMKDAAVAARRQCLEELLGGLRRIDLNASIRDPIAIPNPIQLQANGLGAGLADQRDRS